MIEWEAEPRGQPEIILIATGSEVTATREAAKREVNLLSWERFEGEPPEYRHKVFPPRFHRRLAIEAASPFGWERYVGLEGRIVGLSRFGASAPAKVLAEKFG